MKHLLDKKLVQAKLSHPARGGWIETSFFSETVPKLITSHPARGGWIETLMYCKTSCSVQVPPRTGWVD